MKEQLKFIKSELARTEETTRVLEGMLASPAQAYCVFYLCSTLLQLLVTHFPGLNPFGA